MGEALENDGLPPWPELHGWDATAIVPRRTSPLTIGALVFVKTDNRVYRKRWNGHYHQGFGGPVERYTYEIRKVADETRVSWLLAKYDKQHPEHMHKVPKRDLSSIYGAEDVEEALWIGANAGTIADRVGNLNRRDPQAFAKLKAIAQIVGIEP